MSRNHDTRLERLEKRKKPRQDVIVIWRTIVEADGSTVAPTYYETSDGKHVWEREPNESPEDFERRVSDDVERITDRFAVELRPYKQEIRGGEDDLDGTIARRTGHAGLDFGRTGQALKNASPNHPQG
jgi:hypothetical protein